MKIICNQKILSQKITVVQKAISNKTNSDILKGILLSAKDNLLKLTGYDLEIAIQTKIENIEILKEGSIVINSRLFGDILKKLPNTLIEIEVLNNNMVIIKYENSQFEIKGEPSNEYPDLPKIKSNDKYSLSKNALKNMIKQTVCAVSTDTTKPVLTGELLELSDNKISLVAIDGYRLAVRSYDLLDFEYNNKTIIPGKSLNDLNSLLTDDGNISVEFNDKYAIFNLDDTIIVTRVLEGDFIDYKKLIPKEYNTKILIKTKEFSESIERASLLSMSSTNKNNLIKLIIKSNNLIITSNSDQGNIYENINCALEGDELQIAFNCKYLIDGIKNIDSEEITLEFTTNINPCIIKPVDDTEYTYLILPVRSSN
ncbi:MAG: DNA polymerase III subunit beta [Peptostreptococcaceae bacterium]